MSDNTNTLKKGILGGLGLGTGVIIIIILAVISMCCACSALAYFASQQVQTDSTGSKESKKSTEDSETTDKQDEKEDTKQEEPSLDIYQQNDVIAIDGFKISILEVTPYTTDNQFMTPTQGYEFVAIKVQIENISSENKDYSESDFSLKNSDGETYVSGFCDINPALGYGTLQPTKKATGYVTFEIPEGTAYTGLEFYYEPLWENIQVIWILN